MSLRLKLLLAQLPLALALISIGALSVRTTHYLGSSAQAILKDNYRSVLASQRMKEALERIDSGEVFIALGERSKGEKQTAENRPRFEAELREQEQNITEPGEREATQRLRALWTSYQNRLEGLTPLQEPSALKRYYFDVLEPLFLQVKQADEDVLAINQDAMVHKSELARRSAERINALLLAATLAALLIGAVLSTTSIARLLRPLSVLTQAARRIGQGDLDARAAVSGRDEVATLGQEFNEMAHHLKEYRASSLGDLLQAHNAAQSAIDSLPDAVLIFNLDGSLVSANELAERDLHVDLETGSGPLAKVDPTLRTALEKVRLYVLGGKGAYQPKGFEEALRVMGAEGERYLLPRATPVYAAGGAVSAVTVVVQDVTRLRRFDELKNDVVATVAHEFRTPLTSLRMAIDLCLEGSAGPLSERQLDLLHAAREDCERLQTMVDDLLDLSRLQASGMELNREEITVGSLLSEALAQSHAQAAGHITLRSEDLTENAKLTVDVDRLEIVFSNLINNAIRYSPPEGVVQLRAKAERGAIRFEISDSGQGIPPEYQQRIFEKYFRVPGAPSGSAGLGLYISREIVTAHGGEIGVTSEVGQGSTFWFTLPFDTGPSDRLPARGTHQHV